MEDTISKNDEGFAAIPPMQGEELPASQQQDYFGFQLTKKHYLPDGVSFIEIKAMNEGEKAEYQKKTQRDMVLEKGSGNARFKINPADERHALIETCVVGWNLTRGGLPIPFDNKGRSGPFRDFLTLADPRIIEDLELAIRKLNPWLLADLTVEEIDKQMDELKELREAAVEREAGEGSSSSR